MNRFVQLLKTDVLVQWRNKLYVVGVGVSVVVAALMGWLANPNQLPVLVPVLMVLAVGGTTLLAVAALILFEQDEGTLRATIVSPITTWEYLLSKAVTLCGLVVLESLVMIGGAMALMAIREPVGFPNGITLIVGILATGLVYTLVGILIVVRYDKLTDFLIPMGGVAAVLQLPFLYFAGAVEHPAMLMIPTCASTMLIQGAYVSLPVWKWIYCIFYTLVTVIGLSIWSVSAFEKHIVSKGA